MAANANLAFIQPQGGLAIEPAPLGELDRGLLRIAVEYMRLPRREFIDAVSSTLVVPPDALVFDVSLSVLNRLRFEASVTEPEAKMVLGRQIVASAATLDYPKGGYFLCPRLGRRGQFLDLPMSDAGLPVRVLHGRGW